MDDKKKNGFFDGIPFRSCVLMLLAGVYLVYTGYRLCQNVLNGVEGGSTGFMVAGVIFIICGIAMAVIGARGMIIEEKRKNSEEDSAEKSASEAESDSESEK
jgi:uncharacterized membrane protein